MQNLTNQELIIIAKKHSYHNWEKDVVGHTIIAELCERLIKTGNIDLKQPELVTEEIFDNSDQK